MDPRPTLIALCGMPGAGKSTYAARLGKDPQVFVVLTLDDIRLAGADGTKAWLAMIDYLRALLDLGRSVVVDSCALTAYGRGALLHIGRDYNARCELHIIRASATMCRVRDAQRTKRATVSWPRVEAQYADTMANLGAERSRWDLVLLV